MSTRGLVIVAQLVFVVQAHLPDSYCRSNSGMFSASVSMQGENPKNGIECVQPVHLCQHAFLHIGRFVCVNIAVLHKLEQLQGL